MRDILDVSNAVEAYLSAWRNIDRVKGRAFNLGGGPDNAVSLRQIIAHIADLTGSQVQVLAGLQTGLNDGLVTFGNSVTIDSHTLVQIASGTDEGDVMIGTGVTLRAAGSTIDIGAGSTDVCLIQGYYPSAEDQISFPFAGDAVDDAGMGIDVQQLHAEQG